MLSFVNMPLLVLLEPYSLGIQSSLISGHCYHYGDELIVYLWNMTCKDLKVSLRNEERKEVCFYGQMEEKSYFCRNYTV